MRPMENSDNVPRETAGGENRPTSAGPARTENRDLRFEIGLDPEMMFVSARAEGRLNKEADLDILRRCAAKAMDARCLRIFCDYSMARAAGSVLDIHEKAGCLEQAGIPRAMRIALFYDQDEQKHRFWETVTRNRGYMVRVFKDKTAAIEWLIDSARY